MNTYDLKLDRKITTWERNHYSIEAETKEEAEAKVKKFAEELSFEEGDGFITCETLCDTNEYLEPSKNDGQSTVEIINEEGETIFTNALKPQTT